MINFEHAADQFGTPLYIYDMELIKNNCEHILEGIGTYFNNFKVYYSVKANSNPVLIKRILEMRFGCDASNVNEVRLAKLSGCQCDNMIFTGNFVSVDHLLSLNPDIKINFDDIDVYSMFSKRKYRSEVSFRVNLGYGKGFSKKVQTGGKEAKFGIMKDKIFKAYETAAKAGAKSFGIMNMGGSLVLSPTYYRDVFLEVLNLTKSIESKLKIPFKYIDMGGGYGISYKKPNTALDFKKLGKAFLEACQTAKVDPDSFTLILEPGRIVVGNTGYLVTKVLSIKNSFRNFVGVDANMSSLVRPAMYGARHRIVPLYNFKKYKRFIVCGQACENSDVFGKYNLPADIKPGDLLLICDAGAYGYAMSSNYNSFDKPCEVLFDNDKYLFIRPRENTIEDYFINMKKFGFL